EAVVSPRCPILCSPAKASKGSSGSTFALDRLLHRYAQIRRRVGNNNTCSPQSGDLFLGGAATAADDRPGMAHALARRRGLARDERCYRFLHVLLDELRSPLLRTAADLTHHQDGFRLGILLEKLEHVDKVAAGNGIAADA